MDNDEGSYLGDLTPTKIVMIIFPLSYQGWTAGPNWYTFDQAISVVSKRISDHKWTHLNLRVENRKMVCKMPPSPVRKVGAYTSTY